MQSPFQIKISGNLGCGRSNGGLENLAFPSEALYFFSPRFTERRRRNGGLCTCERASECDFPGSYSIAIAIASSTEAPIAQPTNERNPRGQLSSLPPFAPAGAIVANRVHLHEFRASKTRRRFRFSEMNLNIFSSSNAKLCVTYCNCGCHGDFSKERADTCESM